MKTLAIAAVAALIATGCATAEPPRDLKEGIVFVSAIASDADARIALDKITQAAERACFEGDKWQKWRMHNRIRKDNERCVSEAIESGVKSIDDARLTRLWETL